MTCYSSTVSREIIIKVIKKPLRSSNQSGWWARPAERASSPQSSLQQATQSLTERSEDHSNPLLRSYHELAILA